MFGLFKKKYQNIDVSQFQKMSTSKGAIILDVRSENEFKDGSISGCININVMDSNFKHKIEELDKNKTYLVYCGSGFRSSKACKLMAKTGFSDLHNLKGGIKAWKSAQGN